MTTTTKKTCETCNEEFAAEHDSRWPDLAPDTCTSCKERQRQEHEAQQRVWEAEREREEAQRQAEKNIAAVDELTPVRLLLTDTTDQRFNAKLWQQVQEWKPSDERPWLGLVGEPGACKTRCAFMRLRQLAETAGRRFDCDAISGVDFGDLVLKQFDRTKTTQPRGSWNDYRTQETTVGAVAAKELRMLREVPFLIFDELGKSKPTPGTVAALFALIDYRHSHNLVTLWTSNSSPETFCAEWPEEFAGPSAGRILESSYVIHA